VEGFGQPSEGSELGDVIEAIRQESILEREIIVTIRREYFLDRAVMEIICQEYIQEKVIMEISVRSTFLTEYNEISVSSIF
jgi:hypothetical protein